MKRWNWLQWLLLSIIIAIIALMAIPDWAYPQSLYNPKWVNFVQENDGLVLFALFTCLGLAYWITKISSKRHDKLVADAYADIANYEGEDFVQWYYMWKEKGLSDDDLINCFIGKPVPPALKKELERQGKKIMFKTNLWE